MLRYLVAVLAAPAALWVICLGCGLALERVLRLRLPNALLLPVGLCVAFVVVFPGYVAGANELLAIPLLLVVTALGLLFATGGVRARLNPGWAGVAGLAAYVLYMLPVIAYGHWTWAGYDFVNDTAFEMLLAQHIKDYGTALGAAAQTTQHDTLQAYLSTGYPLGTQALLGTLSGITRTNVAQLYQGFISSLAAISAIALADLARGLLTPRRAALAGFAAAAANLTYQFALQGDIKEIGLMAIVATLLALARRSTLLERPYSSAALLAVATAAGLVAYSATALPYIGAILGFLLVGIVLVKRRRPTWRWAGPGVLCAALAALLAIPVFSTLFTFFEVATASQGSTGTGAAQLGQLLRPLPLRQIAGIWLAGEYRVTILAHRAGLATSILIGILLVSLAPALIRSLRRADIGPLLAIGSIGLILLIVYPRVSPYAQAKLLAMSGPALVAVALAGLLSLRGRGVALAGTGIALVLAGAILASDVLAYRNTFLAPTARIEAITQVANRFKGEGAVLWNEPEEYSKYFARGVELDAPYEPFTPLQVALRKPPEGSIFAHYYDLDRQLLSFVERFKVIVMRRSPAASRPPANYRRVYENAYYEGWQRTASPHVIAHLPLQREYGSSATIRCGALRSLASHAPSGAGLIRAIAPEQRWFNPISDHKRPSGWAPDPAQPGLVYTPTDGRAEGVVSVRGGRYAVWAQGSFPRALQVEVDHRVVGSVSGVNSLGQWARAGTVQLSPGRHVLGILREGGYQHFGPGEAATGTVGAVSLQREQPERLERLAPSRYRRLCGRSADWVELVRP